MLTKNDLEALAKVRLDDAVFLNAFGRASSAYYLAGYAIELALKACIAKLTLPNTIPDKAFIDAIYTHNFAQLLSMAGLKGELDDAIRNDARLGACWGIACNWSEASRYELVDPASAANMLVAVSEPSHGVFQWVKRYW